MESSEIRFIRSVKGCTSHERIRSNDIRQELGVQKITSWYKERRRDHVIEYHGNLK